MARLPFRKKGPRRVTSDYVGMCWQRRALSPTQDFLQMMESIRGLAQTMQPPEVLSRADLTAALQPVLEDSVFSDEFFQNLAEWLGDACTSQVQENNIRFTLEELGEYVWLPEHPLIAYLFRAWDPQWGPFVSEMLMPGGSWHLPLESSAEAQPYFVPLRGPCVVADTTCAEFAETNSAYFDGLLSWWMLSSRVRAWHRAPEEFYTGLCEAALREWRSTHPEVSLASLMAADAILPELIAEDEYRTYEYDPRSLDYARSAAKAWAARGQAVDGLLAEISRG